MIAKVKIDFRRWAVAFLRTLVFYLALPYAWLVAFAEHIESPIDAALVVMLYYFAYQMFQRAANPPHKIEQEIEE